MKFVNKFFLWLATDSQPKSNTIRLDNNVLFSAIVLMAIGIVMVYSASIAYAGRDSGNNNQYFYLMRHVMNLVLGVVAGIITFQVDTRILSKNADKILMIVILVLIAVLIPGIGREINGARRWISLGFMNLQPSELGKLAMAIYVANFLKTGAKNLSVKDYIVLGLAILVVLVCLLAEPDLGSTTVVAVIAFSIFFLAGGPVKFVLALGGLGIAGFSVLVFTSEYRMKRVLGFLDPWEDALGKGYQLSHSLLAFGHGGWTGVGLGNSIEKLYYLPEAHTDFIMAIVGEEFGVVGVLVVLLLFWIIFYRGSTVIATEAKRIPGRKFQGYLANGISIWFFFQCIVNIGVAIGMLPTKGLTMPFISYGGSSILINCIALAILLKIDYENKSYFISKKDDKEKYNY